MGFCLLLFHRLLLSRKSCHGVLHESRPVVLNNPVLKPLKPGTFSRVKKMCNVQRSPLASEKTIFF